jgi:polyphosphate glucokinase
MSPRRRRHILTVDIGGTNVKFRVSNRRAVQTFASSPTMTPSQMMRRIRLLTKDWRFDRVSLGFPGMVIDGRIVTEPANLGRGWVDFNFRAAFDCPVRIMNDAVMQATGGYEGGRMLFLGFGTALGAVAILDSKVHPMELAHLPFSKRGLIQSYVGADALKRLGRTRWSKNALKVIKHLSRLLDVRYVIVGGGNAERLGSTPRYVRIASHDLAFIGGFRAWRRSSWVEL